MSTTIPPPIDVDRYGKLLLKVEAHAHRHGWDGPVHLRLIWNEDLTSREFAAMLRRINPPEPVYAPVTNGRYVSTTLFGHRVLYLSWASLPPEVAAEIREVDPNNTGPGVSPWTTLRRLVMNVAYGDSDDKVETMRALLREPGVLGFAVVGEAWRNQGEAVMQAIRGEVNLGDVPSSVEVRTIYSVDLAGRIQQVQRERKHKAGLLLWDGSRAERYVDAGTAELNPDALLRGDFTTSLRILRDTVLDRLPQTPEEFATRYPTLHEVVEARCSDPREPGSCPTEPHAHHPQHYHLVNGRWYRGGDW